VVLLTYFTLRLTRGLNPTESTSFLMNGPKLGQMRSAYSGPIAASCTHELTASLQHQRLYRCRVRVYVCMVPRTLSKNREHRTSPYREARNFSSSMVHPNPIS
jgi:hypothetical protein